ncbi:hypothetical protein QBC36DRAFT_305910 [Triangularia setosa]|uniref:Uncharacterized protein n=1 Tax=Triangularia setosa TaxID=2587417 RepID=A0AAN7AAX7_9PEZI|nr:hypothetical protein QBC36DRAFT_305910 [Podospora setosa]
MQTCTQAGERGGVVCLLDQDQLLGPLEQQDAGRCKETKALTLRSIHPPCLTSTHIQHQQKATEPSIELVVTPHLHVVTSFSCFAQYGGQDGICAHHRAAAGMTNKSLGGFWTATQPAGNTAGQEGNGSAQARPSLAQHLVRPAEPWPETRVMTDFLLSQCQTNIAWRSLAGIEQRRNLPGGLPCGPRCVGKGADKPENQKIRRGVRCKLQFANASASSDQCCCTYPSH